MGWLLQCQIVGKSFLRMKGDLGVLENAYGMKEMGNRERPRRKIVDWSLVPGYADLSQLIHVNWDSLRDEKVHFLIDNFVEWLGCAESEKYFYTQYCYRYFKDKAWLNPHDDNWIWTTEHYGNFTVRSVYRMLQNFKNLGSGECSIATNLSSLWKKLWKMRFHTRCKSLCGEDVENASWLSKPAEEEHKCWK